MSTAINNDIALDTQEMDSKLLSNTRLLRGGNSLSSEQQQRLEQMSLLLQEIGAEDLSRQHKDFLDNVLSLEGRKLFIAEPQQFLRAQNRLSILRRLMDLKRADSPVRLISILMSHSLI